MLAAQSNEKERGGEGFLPWVCSAWLVCGPQETQGRLGTSLAQAGDLPSRRWDSAAPGQCRVGRWQIKDREEGAELALQGQDVSWTR